MGAVDKLKPAPRELSVVYYNGAKPPCPCIADGVMLAMHTRPGQGTLQIAAEKVSEGMMGVVVITNKKTGEALRYSIADEWLPKILAWPKADPGARYDAAMDADGLCRVELAK